MRLSKLSFVVVGVACAILFVSSPAGAGNVFLRSTPGPGTEGYLSITLDDYGAWAHTTFGGLGDDFHAFGLLPIRPMAFTSGFFLFGPGVERELLADNVPWQGTGVPNIGVDASLDRMVISANVASDTNGDVANDRADSSFRVTSATTNLKFDLIQHLSLHATIPGVSYLRQIYTVRNDGAVAISFNMVRVFDGDLEWSGGFENDEVGTNMHPAGPAGSYVFMQEVIHPDITSITLSGERGQAGNYFGGKHGLTPGGGPPPYDFGTDTEVWDAFGIPTSWQNHIAGVGYSPTNGLSGAAPPGSTVPQDGFIGLDFSVVNLPAGGKTTILMVHTFGLNSPVDPCPEDCQEFPSDAVDVPDLLALLAAWGGPQTPGTTCDLDGSGSINVVDLLTLLAAWGPCP